MTGIGASIAQDDRNVELRLAENAINAGLCRRTPRRWQLLALLTIFVLAPVAQAQIRVSNLNPIAAYSLVALRHDLAVSIEPLAATGLADVAEARLAIHDNKPNAARRAVEHLLVIFELIKAERPTGELDSLIRYARAHFALDDNKQLLADLLLIETVLDDLPTTPSTRMARKHLEETKQALEKSDRPGALKSLDLMRRALYVDSIDRPLHAAEEKLRQAIGQDNNRAVSIDDETLLEIEGDLLQLLNPVKSPDAI